MKMFINYIPQAHCFISLCYRYNIHLKHIMYDSIGSGRMMPLGDDFSVTPWAYTSTSNEKKPHTYITSLQEHIFCGYCPLFRSSANNYSLQ
jgi:hypothetical protein